MPGETTYTILIVEDDATIARLLQENLARWGFDARCVEDFSDVLGAFEAARPHLTLLDISLPYYNGYYWCDRIRRVSSAPILFLSSRSDNMDVVMAVNMGGDDYVAKPFSMEVLIAKINALLRRRVPLRGAGAHAVRRGRDAESGRRLPQRGRGARGADAQ